MASSKSSSLSEPAAERVHRDDYLASGLSQIAQAVAFLNVDCKMARRCELS